ncbi:hypothetical protein TSAR_007601 [Trichomalopsis sarcophagae]|uniref:Uncharacterized protein n=1 Tax=Trichomalopsis sarcophagae TaxID=543379 RepID=A0A232EQM1_9HYME|nr:hypothetical protein TSAR_007601 [Trichomalopsis sarcophagae]
MSHVWVHNHYIGSRCHLCLINIRVVNTPCTGVPQFIPFPQSTPATNFNKSNTAARKEPEYDNFAKKKR